MISPLPSHSKNIPNANDIAPVLPDVRWCPVAIPTYLMAYATAAQAIFMRANGGPAYYRVSDRAKDAI